MSKATDPKSKIDQPGFDLDRLLNPALPTDLTGNLPSHKLQKLLAVFDSPQSRLQIFKILGLIGLVALAWVMLAGLLALFKAWMIVVLTISLAVVVIYREIQRRVRDGWILSGHCANCGYNLLSSPKVCPECGRDAALDEPIWRRMRRELEAKLALEIAEQSPMDLPPSPGIPGEIRGGGDSANKRF